MSWANTRLSLSLPSLSKTGDGSRKDRSVRLRECEGPGPQAMMLPLLVILLNSRLLCLLADHGMLVRGGVYSGGRRVHGSQF